MWTLESALELARRLESHLVVVGWHCAIAGSVMRLGESAKDLDLVMFPHLDLVMFPHRAPAPEVAQDLRRKVLEICGLEIHKTAAQMHAYWSTLGSNDLKHVEVWRDDSGRRVDVIVVS